MAGLRCGRYASIVERAHGRHRLVVCAIACALGAAYACTPFGEDPATPETEAGPPGGDDSGGNAEASIADHGSSDDAKSGGTPSSPLPVGPTTCFSLMGSLGPFARKGSVNPTALVVELVLG